MGLITLLLTDYLPVFSLSIKFTFYDASMAYHYTNKKGQSYYLHTRDIILRGSGKKQIIYFFAKTPGEGAVEDVPEGYKVVENERTGLPVLKKG